MAGHSRHHAQQTVYPFSTTKPHGMGLGLTICQSIIESHQGHLRAQRQPEGGGSSALPCRCKTRSQARLHCVKRNLCLMTPTPNFDPIVYVVDDDPAVLDSVSLLIRSAGLKVMAFPSALEFLAAFIPIRSPAWCWTSACLAPPAWNCKPNSKAPAWPIIFITGHGDVAQCTRAFKAGASDSHQTDRRRTADGSRAQGAAPLHPDPRKNRTHPRSRNAPGPPVQPRAGSAATGHRSLSSSKSAAAWACRRAPSKPTAPACSTN